MATPITMTTSMITTATTMLTDVVVGPSLETDVVVGPIRETGVVVAPSLAGLLVGCMVWEWVGVDTVERKHTSCHFR